MCINRVLTLTAKYKDSVPWAVQNGWTTREAIWDAESDESR